MESSHSTAAAVNPDILLGLELLEKEQQQQRLESLLKVARQQRQIADNLADKRTSNFMLLFLFLYCLLGASLTLPKFTILPHQVRLYYALEALPVLIAFSGFYMSVLFLLFSRDASRRKKSWCEAIRLLEQKHDQPLELWIEKRNTSTQYYSQSGIRMAIALFVILTWIVLYNYFTFTTSGVIGSVISLFITTMVYVIMDIQLGKSVLTTPR